MKTFMKYVYVSFFSVEKNVEQCHYVYNIQVFVSSIYHLWGYWYWICNIYIYQSIDLITLCPFFVKTHFHHVKCFMWHNVFYFLLLFLSVSTISKIVVDLSSSYSYCIYIHIYTYIYIYKSCSQSVVWHIYT